MEGKKTDFVENNPYLVYASDPDITYSGGDSPIPPEPPAPVGMVPFYVINKEPEYITPITAVYFDAPSMDVDPVAIELEKVFESNSESYYMGEARLGSCIMIEAANQSAYSTDASGWYYQEQGFPMCLEISGGGEGSGGIAVMTVLSNLIYREPTQEDFNSDDFSWADWPVSKIQIDIGN